MDKIEFLKRAIFVMLGVTLIILFAFCGNNEEANDDEIDTTQVVDVVKKTREELIINRDTMVFADPDSISDFEYKHTPEINIGEINEEMLTEVIIKIGSNGIVHPSEDNHWIDYVVIFLDGTEAERKEAENGPGSNEVSFLLNLKGVKEIKAEAGCNLHGIWFNSKSL